MSKLVLGTNAVGMDEPAWSLKEVNEQSPGSRGMRRWLVVKVVRGDQVVEFRRNLGPTSKFTRSEFLVPGGIYDPETRRGEVLHTVGELLDIAEYLRSDKHQPELPQATDLIGAYREQAERRKLWRWKRSQIGPLHRVQRG